MGNSLVKATAAAFGIQWAGWVISRLLKTARFNDLASYLLEAPVGTLTFVPLVLQSLRWGGQYHLRQKVQTGMVVSWSARLGLYLLIRMLIEGKDKRYNRVGDSFQLSFVFWTLQAVWVFLTLLPTFILNSKKKDKPLTVRDYIGWVLWTIGFICESFADHQKFKFKGNPDNKGQFIRHGLWSIVRYPNYLGEIMMWTGLYASASSQLKGWEHIGVISPIFTVYLLAKLSGIPIQERMGQKRWGSDPAYQAYLKITQKLIPFIW